MAAPQTTDVLSVNRRAIFETNLKRTGRRFAHEGAEATTEMNARNTSRFSLVRFGTVYVTASRSKSQSHMPRSAKYRTNLFESAQTWLFATEGEASDSSMYAILLHGAPAKKKHKDDETNLAIPSFARVVFPDATGKIITGIDLFTEVAECRDVVHEFMPPVENTPNATPQPRRDRKPDVVGDWLTKK